MHQVCINRHRQTANDHMTNKEPAKEPVWNGRTLPAESATRIAGRLKGTKVSTAVDTHTDRSADIRFRKTDMEFWVIVGNDYFESKDGREVERWAKYMLGRDSSITWQGVIDVTYDSDRWGYSRHSGADKAANVEIKVTRYWIGMTESGHWRKLDWAKGDPNSPVAVPDVDRVAHSETFSDAEDSDRYERRDKHLRGKNFKLPHKAGDKRVLLPYDRATFAGIVQLIKAVKNVVGEIERLVTTKDGLAVLALAGSEKREPFLLTGASSMKSEPVDAEFEVIGEDDDEDTST